MPDYLKVRHGLFEGGTNGPNTANFSGGSSEAGNMKRLLHKLKDTERQ